MMYVRKNIEFSIHKPILTAEQQPITATASSSWSGFLIFFDWLLTIAQQKIEERMLSLRSLNYIWDDYPEVSMEKRHLLAEEKISENCPIREDV